MEAIDTLQHNYDAWRETPNVIEWIRLRMKASEREATAACKVAQQHATFRSSL
jgi:hypothetical protein